MAVLPAGAGCDAAPAPKPPEAVPAPQPLAVAPESLVKRLEAMQPAWPRQPDCAHDKCVALTFDDGPGEHTGRLLDILREKGAKATFFVVGQMVAAAHGAATVRRIVAEGHELGNHSWSHPMLTGLSGQRLAHEIGHTGDLVRRITGVRMRVMRPPYGATDRAVAEQTRRRGLAQILWNVDTFDWRDRVPALVAKRGAHVRPGSIVLMHDIHPTTVKAVPRLLDTLDHRGYSFVTVTELYGDRLRPGRRYEQLRRR
ncbi:polysaccharide deacetylase family protein [Nonomuraea sp. ATR24]|uniref:polysaccharide deacetylase family protein n=1 Tax=Nonomuraea TaxID=83681 RepID=UPI001FE621D2|nr:polysaccharide deacetylase family protein [Nonomuraea ceibae]